MTPPRQLIWVGAALLFFFALIWAFQSILPPFVIGMAVAYFLDPVCDRLQAVGLSRTLATSVVTLLFIVLVGLVLGLIVPLVAGEVTQLFRQLPSYFEQLRARVVELSQLMEAQLDPFVLDQIQQFLTGSQERLTKWVTGIVRNVVTGGFALFHVLSLLLITPIVAFYLLRDWDVLMGEADSLLPPAYADTIREQLREVDRKLAGFVRGVGTVCLVLGAFYAIGLTAAGLKFGLVIGLVSGLISFVPFLGAFVGLLASVGMALAQFDSYLMVAVIAVIYFAGQFLEGNVLHPLLVGERVGLHPVWVIFAVMAGGVLFGLVGVLIAVPGAAVIGVGVRFAVQQYRTKVLEPEARQTQQAVDSET
ncbi:Predicted PurR-regulated permease PerM [Limimonas halophila]|uniref:Predicted PurR-regulated permease PerM n=1 Tax=Limimonas halophila TaxID=1082479 RepID=A0A1G7P8F8_9PROT|nr:AI-2E family transporter [Limimonas halophila]SDF82504.1 Predicted PurR-regulated permease PerM [Limimonas halophila]